MNIKLVVIAVIAVIGAGAGGTWIAKSYVATSASADVQLKVVPDVNLPNVPDEMLCPELKRCIHVGMASGGGSREEATESCTKACKD